MSSTQIRGNKQLKNLTISNDQIIDATIELDKLKDGAELIKRDGSVALTGDFNLSNNNIKNLAAPVDANDAVRKADLDAATSGVLINREIPSGTIDGENTEFTLANVPNFGTEQVFVNGTLLNSGASADYVILDDVITFSVAPQVDDIVLVNYIYNATALNVGFESTLNDLDERISALEAGGGGGGEGSVSALDDLSDVAITSATKGQFIVHNGTSFINSNTIQPSNASSKPLIIKGATSQSAALLELQNSSGTALFAIDSAGSVSVGEVPVARVSGLATVATSGSYNDLTNKPSLFDGAYSSLSGAPSLATVATSGSYNDLTNKPSLATVATSGSYNDLTNTPTVTAVAIYQDAEFTWVTSNSASTRTITHNKGRFPDLVKVYVKSDSDTWVEHYERDSTSGNNYGYDVYRTDSTVNATVIRFFQTQAETNLTCRIRLYWFGGSDVATVSSSGGWVS